MHGRGKRTRTTADKTNCGPGFRRGVLEQDLVDCWNGGVPGCMVAVENRPKVCGREFGWDNDGTVGGDGSEEAS